MGIVLYLDGLQYKQNSVIYLFYAMIAWSGFCLLLLDLLSSGTTWGLSSLCGIELGPQHLSTWGNTLESSYAGWVSYYEAGELQIVWSRNLRENLGIL